MMNKSNTNLKSLRLWRLVIFGLIGAAFGYLLASGLFAAPQNIDFSLFLFYEYDVLFVFLMAVTVALLVWNVIGLFRLSRMKETHQGSEQPITPKENMFNTLLKVSSYNTIISFTTLILALAHAMRSVSVNNENTYMLVNMIVSAVLFIIVAFLQNRTLAFFNQVYPNRKINFNASRNKETERELFAEMDEGERWIVYRSAYSAFKTTNILLIAGIVFFLIYSVVFGFAPLPIIVLGIIWLGQNMAYQREVSRHYKL